MLKLVVIQPGKPDRVVNVQGDVATIGRVAPSNVVVDLPFVSKQHLRILHGTVAVDLGSSNGTFVEGRRLTEAIVLGGRTLAIGQSDLELRVEVEEPAADTAPADADLEGLRSRYVLLEAQLADVQRELAEAREGDDRDVQLSRLKGENDSLRARIESLREQLEERESDDAESPQARLAMQRVENVQGLNESLQDEVERLRAEVAAYESRPVVPVEAPREVEDDGALEEARAELARLRASLEEERGRSRGLQEQTELVRRLRKELEAQRAPRAAAASPELTQALDESRKEAAALRSRLAEIEGRLAESKPATPEKNVSDLFFKLQGENAELRRKLTALEKAAGGAAGAPAAAGGQREPKHVKELMDARFRIASLEAELARASTRKPPVPAEPVEKPAPRPASPAGIDIRRVLTVFVDKDIEGVSSSVQAPLEEFVVVESLRLLRQVERVVTRLSGDLIQLLRVDRTMLPETTGNYRELVGGILARPDDASTRELLQEYLEKLARWLVASTGAHRKAALQFAFTLRDDLSEKSLIAREPLPPYARVPMLAGSELWRRVQDYLQRLSNDTIDERIEELARAQAQSILSSAS